MRTQIPRTLAQPTTGSAQPSLIKPHLVNLSGSGLTLKGIIIERNLESPDAAVNAEMDKRLVKPSNHIIVVHSSSPASLEWRVDSSRKVALFSEGDAILSPAGFFAPHRWDAEIEILLLAINPGLVNRVAEEMNRPGRVELIPRFQFRDGFLRHLTRNLMNEFEQDVPADPIYAQSLTHTLIAHLIRKYSVAGIKLPATNRGLPPRKLRLVVDYIHDHLSDDLALETMARLVDLSPAYFLTLFKQSTGLAPHQYVMTRRIEKAKALLQQTTISIAEIASQSGFADQSHLTRLLRRHTGLTPKISRGDEIV